jgi:hypothetical protein
MLHIILISSVLKDRAMDQAVSLWPLTAEAQILFRASPCKIDGAQPGTGRGFSAEISMFPCQPHTNKAPYLSHLHAALIGWTEGTLKKQSRFGNKGVTDRKVLSLIVVFKD